jgi:hypothetical protein
MNSSRVNASNIEKLVNAWSGGGTGGIGGPPGGWGGFGGRDKNGSGDNVGVDSSSSSSSNMDTMNNLPEDHTNTTTNDSNNSIDKSNNNWLQYLWPFRGNNMTGEELMDKATQRAEQMSHKRTMREERRKARTKEKALKEAAKVVVDYRPVMSRIMDDYLFRCPSWHLAQSISRTRRDRGQHRSDNVFVYQFSHSTHIPGFPECWGKSCHTAEMPYVFQAMDVIRSNYSTLGPHAQREAPSSPEYPYTDMVLAYKGVMEATTTGETENTTFIDFERGNSTTASTHQDSLSKGFQRILGHFFGDYFKEDVDEEIASDMADRWVAFARTGDPNHDASPTARWRPWRYVLDEGNQRQGKHGPWQPEDFDRIFSATGVEEEGEEIELNKTDADESIWSDDSEFRAYRRRTLAALGMKVVEEDVFQTLLSRTKKRDDDDSFFDALFGNPARTNKDTLKAKKARRQAIRRLQQIAQDLGFIGTGLRGEPKRVGVPGHRNNDALWEEDFFPEILELKWPPEGRLVERDCTCDMWDKIRYRY